jgi:glycosyltransferase involved in cell wall biosynthesis
MKISIIVPVYNTKKHLDKCLSSLVNQTIKDRKIIIINDGSTEDITEIIKKYKGKIDYYKNKNHGIGYTRNFGIRKAKGEYIGFVDSDDYVENNTY